MRAEVYMVSLIIRVDGLLYNSLELMQTQIKPLNLPLVAESLAPGSDGDQR